MKKPSISVPKLEPIHPKINILPNSVQIGLVIHWVGQNSPNPGVGRGCVSRLHRRHLTAPPMMNRRPPSRPRTGQRKQRLKEDGGISAKDRDGAPLLPGEELGSIAGLDGMGFLCFIGRVLFTSIFVLSAYQEAKEFGHDGGPTAKALEPKFDLFVKNVSTYTGLALPHVEVKIVVAVTIVLRAYGAFMFILFSPVGVFLLEVYLVFITPIVYDFYNYKKWSPEFVQLFDQFLQNAALYAALGFYWGMRRSIKLAKRDL